MTNTSPKRNPADVARQAVSLMIQGYTRTQLVCTAACLGIADHLANTPRNSDELASLTGVADRLLRRLMRGFVACGLIRQLDDGRFELTAMGEVLKTDTPGSLRNLALRVHALDYQAWGALSQSARTGQTAFDSVFGKSFYEYLALSEFHDFFNEEMADTSLDTAKQLSASYDFGQFVEIVDVGGGYGVLISEILAANGARTGVLFDLPCVTDRARAYLDCRGLSHRCHVVSGDFLADSVPSGGDLYILKLVLHNWSDDRCLEILRNCRRAMNDSDSGKLVIIERVVPEKIEGANPVVGLDLAMLVLLGGGERTADTFQCLLAQTGFELIRVIPTGTPFSLIEARAVSR